MGNRPGSTPPQLYLPLRQHQMQHASSIGNTVCAAQSCWGAAQRKQVRIQRTGRSDAGHSGYTSSRRYLAVTWASFLNTPATCRHRPRRTSTSGSWWHLCQDTLAQDGQGTHTDAMTMKTLTTVSTQLAPGLSTSDTSSEHRRSCCSLLCTVCYVVLPTCAYSTTIKPVR